MQALFDNCPCVLEFGKHCGRHSVKEKDRSEFRLTYDLLLYSDSAVLALRAMNRELRLTPGETLLLSSGATIFIDTLQGGDITVISYRTEGSQGTFAPILLATTTPKRTKQAYLHFLNACEEQKPLRKLAMRSAFYTVLYLLARNSKSGNRLFLKESKLREARSYLDRHFADRDLCVTDAANKSGISPAYLRRLFLELEGCTPIEYVNRIRIRQAEKMISEGAHSFEKIAHACGLSDPSYLKKLLKNAESTEKSK